MYQHHIYILYIINCIYRDEYIERGREREKQRKIHRERDHINIYVYIGTYT